MEMNNIGQSNNTNLPTSVGGNSHVNTESKEVTNESVKFQSEPTSSPINRLNALDSKILEDNAYNDIKDEAFKVEYKIDKLENELRMIDKQIFAAQSLGDHQKIDILNIKKHSIQNQLKHLNSSYQGADVSRKLSSNLTSLMTPKKSGIRGSIDKFKEKFKEKVLTKISRRFNSGQGLKSALTKLESINKNVNELVSHQAPYGESEEKYDQLTKYLSKANTIQYQVSRELSKNDSQIKGNPFADQISKEKSEELSKKISAQNSKSDKAQKNALNLNNNLK